MHVVAHVNCLSHAEAVLGACSVLSRQTITSPAAWLSGEQFPCPWLAARSALIPTSFSGSARVVEVLGELSYRAFVGRRCSAGSPRHQPPARQPSSLTCSCAWSALRSELHHSDHHHPARTCDAASTSSCSTRVVALRSSRASFSARDFSRCSACCTPEPPPVVHRERRLLTVHQVTPTTVLDAGFHTHLL